VREGSTPNRIPHITVYGAVPRRSVLGVLLYTACHATARLAATRPSLQHLTQATPQSFCLAGAAWEPPRELESIDRHPRQPGELHHVANAKKSHGASLMGSRAELRPVLIVFFAEQ